MVSIRVDVVERLSVAYYDTYARGSLWNEHDLEDPEDDITLFLNHLPGRRMLDVGCGWARYVHKFLESGVEYVGIDHSPEMIRAAQKTISGLTCRVMSYRKLTFPDASFDGLWCCCIFSSIPKRTMPRVLLGLKRVLRAGGIMLMVMPAVRDSDETLLRDGADVPYLFHASYDLCECVALLEGAGFRVMQTNDRWYHGAQSLLAYT